LILSFCIDSPIYRWIFHIQQQRHQITSILFFLANVSSKNNNKKGNNVVTKPVNAQWIVGGGKQNRIIIFCGTFFSRTVHECRKPT
jgi:hypothetical protein